MLYFIYNFTDLWIKSLYSSYKINTVRTLIRQSARWAIASENDKNNMIAVLHANYAAGYLWAAIDVATSRDIEKITGINFLEFKNKILTIQDFATMRMSALCPEWAPAPSLLSKIAGESV